ncbi:GTP diphosphokinase [Thalassotalea sp. LPB0316]|uniref:GTP diphosphokinase n=1 Tax=Thalassotalea sp. LPB0316 TaxID=2769490 RepID=UPI0018695829|nr:GTP diphosphokinase [Thalassotalea sp. LPB0316]QOL25568.1 GTP diphosphokinase [Thalassotalea sp. LPB0316]
MVSVRKSHLISEHSFEQWLSQLELTQAKRDALDALWQKIHHHYNDEDESLTKSLEMVEILAELNLDKDSLCAAFIYPLIEYHALTLEQAEELLTKKVFVLVKGVDQMDAIKTLQQGHNNPVAVKQIDNIRKMLLAMVDDVRAVVIKLAERLCYLRLVKNADEETRVLAAKETANIYAPLANRLGIGQLKWELEDISFRYLHPETYMKIAKMLDGKRLERERYMTDFVNNLQHQLEKMNVKGTVYGRPKHIYSIWKKMSKKSLDFEQLFDVRAVRILVEELQDCYGALGVVHTNWKHLPSEFDDYVATPKPNGYQSIHTVVLGPEGKPVEVQIRTEAMHQDAELGVAAHWKYKEGSASGKKTGFDEKVNWLRKILQWQEDVSESGEMLEELRSQVFEDRIYAFTPNGDVIDLPVGSTPLDFAYYIHTNVGHCCIGAKISGRIVPFTYQLQTGDQVEILTSKNPNPSRDWLNPNLGYLHSGRARAKVQSFFRLLDRDKNIAAGKEMLEAESTRSQIPLSQLSEVIGKFNMTTIDDLYAAIGTANIRLQQVMNYLQQLIKKSQPEEEIDPQSLVSQSSQAKTSSDNAITVSGVGNLLTHMAKCCHPVPGDEIEGFITQGRGISVHRKDCEQLATSLEQQPERGVEVQWGDDVKSTYQVTIAIISGDRSGLLRDVSTLIANERISILGMQSQTDKAKQNSRMSITMEIANAEVLARLTNKILQLDDVSEVIRL